MNNAKRAPIGGLRTLTLDQLFAHPFPDREHLVFPWLRQGESALLWAPVGLGKTMLSLTLALAVAGGGKVLGWEAHRPRSVLLVDGEMHAADLRDRLQMLAGTIEGCDMAAAGRNLRVLCRQMQDGDVKFPDLAESVVPDAGRKAGQDVILAVARQAQAELVILDNLTTLAGVEDENSAAALGPVVQFLLRVKQAGHACILVHHAGKSGTNFRGSSAIATTFETIIGLRRLEGHAVGDGVGFELCWEKYRGKPTAATRDATVTLEGDLEGVQRWTSKPAVRAEMDALLEAVRSGRYRTQRELAEALNMDPTKITRLKHRAQGQHLMAPKEWDEFMSGALMEDAQADF
ncbi:MAG: AAA family ATPase [Alphaproteobacteria bacterium]|nr:AAA family ATPase [Alphaproteobacteria bacterium]